MNGGTCTDGVNRYTCKCPAGYTGANCESRKSDFNTYVKRNDEGIVIKYMTKFNETYLS